MSNGNREYRSISFTPVRRRSLCSRWLYLIAAAALSILILVLLHADGVRHFYQPRKWKAKGGKQHSSQFSATVHTSPGPAPKPVPSTQSPTRIPTASPLVATRTEAPSVHVEMNDTQPTNDASVSPPIAINNTDSSLPASPNTTLELPSTTNVSFPFRWSTPVIQPANRVHDLVSAYLCQGPKYDQFTAELRDYAARQITSGHKHALWGQRGLPPDTWILIWGNSHTRQMANSLISQHNGEIIKLKIYDEDINKNMARRYDLSQNRSVWVIANSYVAYSHEWPSLLQNQMARKLWKMKAMIIGAFNTCNAPVHTNFADEMEELKGQFAGVDCDRVEGPGPTEIASVYDGPLAYTSMFATYRHKDIDQARREMMQLIKTQGQERTLAFLGARHYIKDLGVECGSANHSGVSDCVNTEEAARYYHRCIGAKGGHPDLLAWDMVDFVYDAVEGKTRPPRR